MYKKNRVLLVLIHLSTCFVKVTTGCLHIGRLKHIGLFHNFLSHQEKQNMPDNSLWKEFCWLVVDTFSSCSIQISSFCYQSISIFWEKNMYPNIIWRSLESSNFCCLLRMYTFMTQKYSRIQVALSKKHCLNEKFHAIQNY